MHLWASPKMLTRCWCLHELGVAIANGKELEVALLPSGAASFCQTMRGNFGSILRTILASDNSENAVATRPHDKERDLLRHPGNHELRAIQRARGDADQRVAPLPARRATEKVARGRQNHGRMSTKRGFKFLQSARARRAGGGGEELYLVRKGPNAQRPGLLLIYNILGTHMRTRCVHRTYTHQRITSLSLHGPLCRRLLRQEAQSWSRPPAPPPWPPWRLGSAP